MNTRINETDDAATATPSLFRTRNGLAAAARAEIVRLLNQRLADCIDLQGQCKQAHWNVRGPQFIALHRLFDEVADDVAGYADLIAERIAQLGGVAEGTAQVVARRSTLQAYPLTLTAGEDHVAALSDALGDFAREVRIGIEEMNELEDADAADILTSVSRGIDKWLWFVEAHLPPRQETVPDDVRVAEGKPSSTSERIQVTSNQRSSGQQ